MGIQGLLPLLKSIQKPTHLRNFTGQTLGVDAYGWLHRGTVSCAIELAQQKPTRKHIDFALGRVRMLIHFGIKPYLVFDGDYLPSKAHTEKERAARRKESKKVGLELLAMGRVAHAHQELQKAVDVTPSMARELIEELKRLDVPYVVAPYEADSQLAYLEKQGIISGVISEDSDLLVFGVKCLLTKLDQYGECVMINRADFTACRDISMVGWTDKEFRIMAMLSGCDYLPGIDKMGLKTAYRLVRKHKVTERIVRTVQFDGKMKVPAGYLEAFTKAERTFLYQWVFCPEARALVNLNHVPADLDIAGMTYLGEKVEDEAAAGVAAGDLDPSTKQRLIFNHTPRHPATQSRPLQTPDEKQGKPISEFFKPKRTPLAELDPNSFTPSPSQQRLLQNQQRVSWSASQISTTRTSAIGLSDSTNMPSSAPQAGRRRINNQFSNMHGISPKRPRLCSESPLAAAMGGSVGLGSATSRFFPKQKAPTSTSTQKTSPRGRKEDFELWSDDSAAEAVAAMTSVPEATAEDPGGRKVASPKKRKKLDIFADPSPDGDVSAMQFESAPGKAAEDTRTSAITATSQTISDVKSPVTPLKSTKSRVERTVFSNGIDARFEALKSKFGFQASTPQKPIHRTRSAPQRTLLQEEDHSEVLHNPRSQPSPEKTLEETYVEVPSSSPITGAKRPPEEGADDIGEADEERPALERRRASGVTSQFALQGSEDLLVPNSPESASDDGRIQPKLSLSRFAFSGR